MNISIVSLVILGIIATFSLYVVLRLASIIKEISTLNNEKIYGILELFTDGVLARNVDEFAMLRENAKIEKIIREDVKPLVRENTPPPIYTTPKPLTDIEIENELFGK